MWSKIREEYWYLHNTFHSSEVILWSRIQVLVASLWLTASHTDLSALLEPKYLTYWMLVNGVITELLRRRGAEYDPSGDIK